MRRNQFRYAVCVCVLTVCISVCLPAVGQPPQLDTELTRILDLMEQRQKQAGIIRIKAEGTRFVPKGAGTEYLGGAQGILEPGEIIPPHDERTDVSEDFTFDFPNQRWRMQRFEKLNGKVSSWVKAYDGKKFYNADGGGVPVEELGPAFRPKEVGTQVGGDKADNFISVWWPYLFSQGFVLTKHQQPFHLGEFALKIDREELYVHGSGIADGTQCLILRQFPYGPKNRFQYFEYTVGRNDGAVRRAVWWHETNSSNNQKTLKKTVEISISYRKSGDTLIPTNWFSDLLYLHKGTHKTRHSYKMRVIDFETGETLTDRFTITPAIATVVRERRYPTDVDALRAKDETVVHYEVDESGKWIEGQLVEGKFKPRHQYIWWWVAGGACLLAGIGGWLRYRNRITASDNPQTGGAT